MTKERSRIKFIDVFKGLGILSVIIGHIGLGGENCVIYRGAFQMPMFFFISGFLFKESYAFFDFIKRKANALIKPYFIYGIINLIFCLIVLSNFHIDKYLYRFLWINNEPPIYITGAIWFLTCLFFVNIFYFVFNKYLKKYWLEGIILLLIVVESFIKIKLPYSIDTAIYMLPIFYVGVKFKELQKKCDDKKMLFMALILLIVCSFTIFYNGRVNPRTNTYANIFLFYFNALGISFALFYFSKIISNIKWAGVNLISFIGTHSLEFMCIHQMVLKTLQMNNIENQWLLLFLLLFIMIVSLCIYDYSKVSFSKVIGRLKCK